MKKILIGLLLVFKTFGSVAEKIPALHIPLDLSQSGLQPCDLTIQYKIYCQPRCFSRDPIKNVIYQTPPMTSVAKVNGNGIIETPEVDLAMFSSVMDFTGTIDEAVVSIAVTSPTGPVFSIYASSRAKIEQLSANVIKVVRIDGATIQLTLKGGPLFGGSESQESRSFITFSAFGDEKRPDVGGSPSYLWSLSRLRNLEFNNDRGTANPLSSLSHLPPLPTDYYATILPLSAQQLRFSIYFGMGEIDFGRAEISVPMAPDALQKIGTLDLK